MTGTITTYDGVRWQLPPLTGWQLLRTDGHSCDSFTVRFVWKPDALSALQAAVRFDAQDGNTPRFSGIVDEVTLTESEDGVTACITGRSLLGRLLDSTVPATQWSRASWRDIAAKYLQPYGVTQIETNVPIPDLPLFQVDTGTTCFAAVQGFLRHSCGVTPRMKPDGTLCVGGSGDRFLLTHSAGIRRAVWRQQRYGVTSEVQCVRKGSISTAKNDAFAAIGGLRQQVFAESGTYLRASHRTAQQRLAESAAEFETLEVWLPGSFLAEPADTVEADLPQLGVQAAFTAREVESTCTGSGLSCRMLLVRGV